MRKLIVAAALSVAFGVLADDLPEADAEVVQEMKDFCMEVASEDGTGSQTLEQFLLNCVNQELESEGYQPVKSISA